MVDSLSAGVASAGMQPGVDALLAAYPELTPGGAERWLTARRALLTGRAGPAADRARAASSSHAATGACTHARGMAEDATHALERWDAGLGTLCELCSATLPFDRLDSAPVAVRCTGCARPYDADTRWCR